MSGDVDAILIGAGHNALVAANLLAEQGWSVLVLEEQNEPGGAVRSGEITEPGFTSDLLRGWRVAETAWCSPRSARSSTT